MKEKPVKEVANKKGPNKKELRREGLDHSSI